MPTDDFDPLGYVFGDQLGEASAEDFEGDTLAERINTKRKEATPSVGWWVIGGLTLSILFLDSINTARKKRR